MVNMYPQTKPIVYLELLLIVQTLPSVITYSTGIYTPRDMFRAGFFLTIVSIAVMMFTALVWWPMIGLN